MYKPPLEWPLTPGSQAGRCLCGNSVRECGTCAQERVLCQCVVCGVCGASEHVEAHAKDNHMAVSAERGMPRPLMMFRVGGFSDGSDEWECACSYATADADQMRQHCSNVLLPRPQRCHHSAHKYKGEFCRECISRAKGRKGWLCDLCGGAKVKESNPLRHWKENHCRTKRLRRSQRACSLDGADRHNKLTATPACKFPGCHASDSCRVRSHNHSCTLIIQNHNGGTGGRLDRSIVPSSVSQHATQLVHNLELRSALLFGVPDSKGQWKTLRTALLTRGIDMEDLVWTTTSFPYQGMAQTHKFGSCVIHWLWRRGK